jgi:hypothetical protein
MAIGLQQMHPALVHAPIALLPVAVGADVIGAVSRNEPLLSLGKEAMLLSAAATDRVHGVRHMIPEVGKGKICSHGLDSPAPATSLSSAGRSADGI